MTSIGPDEHALLRYHVDAAPGRRAVAAVGGRRRGARPGRAAGPRHRRAPRRYFTGFGHDHLRVAVRASEECWPLSAALRVELALEVRL
ncbi:hypothetical protein [Actinokineospora sp.]|uniref:hypothetical protein n=1 Tax=Actinokineospora sp. TaxID=1872133 RepID=UPI0040380B18